MMKIYKLHICISRRTVELKIKKLKANRTKIIDTKVVIMIKRLNLNRRYEKNNK